MRKKVESKAIHIGIINGPNLNLLGKREPDIYGNQSFEDYLLELRAQFPDVHFTYFQSNHEGALIDCLQAWNGQQDAIILNAGGYTHTSIALRDCVSAIATPVAEVHISNLLQRETFRQHSYLTDVCQFTIMGMGLAGYAQAVRQLIA